MSRQHIAEPTLEIFTLGLDELRSIRRMIAEQEASERSEKDCLWSDGCD